MLTDILDKIKEEFIKGNIVIVCESVGKYHVNSIGYIDIYVAGSWYGSVWRDNYDRFFEARSIDKYYPFRETSVRYVD